MVRFLVIKTDPASSDDKPTIDWDIDRWENDGGKNFMSFGAQ